MQNIKRHRVRGLAGAFLILFILEVLTLPAVLWYTYADRSDGPDHTITFKKNELHWDRQTQVDDNGAADISVFDKRYASVKADEDVVAPGTEGDALIRLKNDAKGAISYTAVVYGKTGPVPVEIEGSGSSDAEGLYLPDGVGKDDVRGVTRGRLAPGRSADMDIRWNWDFTRGPEGDMEDTALGEKGTDEVTAGIYITVQYEGGGSGGDGDSGDDAVILPSPKTGDPGLMGGYLILLAVSGLIVLLLLLRRREEREDG